VAGKLLKAAFILPVAVLSGAPLKEQTVIVIASVHTPNVQKEQVLSVECSARRWSTCSEIGFPVQPTVSTSFLVTVA
jgi:hypothetical protein